jgi:SAM-dependent methyltransferase
MDAAHMDAGAWDERYRASELVWGAEPNRFVRQLCERLPLGKALDLACGEGRNALWLARLGWRVRGVDFSPAAIDRAHELTSREPELVRLRLSWKVADVTKDPPKRSSVDLVVLSYVHLLPEQSAWLIEASARAVKAGGHLVIVGHDRRNIDEGVGGPQDPAVLYVPAIVAMQLVDEGFEIEVAETVRRPTLDGGALDTVVRARRPAEY